MLEMRRAGQALGEDAAMRAMFSARKEVFVDLLKWDLPVLAGRFEVDQFDNPDADYLILLDPDGKHRASARLLRTDRPHILGSLYPYLCASSVPVGPSIREITRFCLDRHQRAQNRRSARNQLVTALAEYAFANGITDYTGVADLSWLEQILTFGWDCRMIGEPMREGALWLAALHIRIDADTIGKLQTAGTYEPAQFGHPPESACGAASQGRPS